MLSSSLSRRGRSSRMPRCADAPARSCRPRGDDRISDDPGADGRIADGRPAAGHRADAHRGLRGDGRISALAERTIALRDDRTRGLSKLRAPSRGGRELRPAWSGEDASRFCHGFDSPRSAARRSGRLPKSLRGPRSGRAAGENFLSPPNFRSGRSPRGDRHRATAARCRDDRPAAGRHAAYRAASRRHPRAGCRASCRRISGRKTRGRTGIAAIASRRAGCRGASRHRRGDGHPG